MSEQNKMHNMLNKTDVLYGLFSLPISDNFWLLVPHLVTGDSTNTRVSISTLIIFYHPMIWIWKYMIGDCLCKAKQISTEMSLNTAAEKASKQELQNRKDTQITQKHRKRPKTKVAAIAHL